MKEGFIMRKKIVIIAVCLVAAIALFFGGGFLYNMSRYKKAIAETEITTPDLSLIQDGVYNGAFNAFVVSADVDVTVYNHKITGITINEHKNGRGAGAESIIDEVLSKQSLEVDAITGATNSSKVILKAIEGALNIQE